MNTRNIEDTENPEGPSKTSEQAQGEQPSGQTSEAKPQTEPAPPSARPVTTADADVPPDDRSAIDLIRALKSGDLAAKNLNTEARRTCVGHLMAEGLSSGEIAHVLKCSERTVERDRHAIRDRNALRPDPGLVNRIAGEFLAEVEAGIGHVRRAARDPAATPADRIMAARTGVEIRDRYIERMQSLGFLPSAMQRSRVEVSSTGEGASLVQVNQQFASIFQLAATDACLDGTPQQVEFLRGVLRQIEATSPPPVDARSSPAITSAAIQGPVGSPSGPPTPNPAVASGPGGQVGRAGGGTGT